jgi:hypothetical protein
MAITLNLPPEAEAILIRHAAAEGIGIEAYVQSLLPTQDPMELPHALSREERLQLWEEFCEPVEGVEVHPNETFNREMIYFDHD